MSGRSVCCCRTAPKKNSGGCINAARSMCFSSKYTQIELFWSRTWPQTKLERIRFPLQHNKSSAPICHPGCVWKGKQRRENIPQLLRPSRIFRLTQDPPWENNLLCGVRGKKEEKKKQRAERSPKVGHRNLAEPGLSEWKRSRTSPCRP